MANRETGVGARRAAPAWRRAFLRALARTGNVRLAAREAGVTHAAAYLARQRDAAFAARWARVVGSGPRLRSGRAVGGGDNEPRLRPRRAGGERSGAGTDVNVAANGGAAIGVSGDLVPRQSANAGMQLVRAGKGRWSRKAEGTFLAVLADTACVRRAAEAAGFSTTALYKRRAAYPDFAARWAEAEALALERIPGFLARAAIATFDPVTAAAEQPRVSIDQAIAISRLKGGPARQAGHGRALAAAVPVRVSEAELAASIEKKLDMLHRRMRAKRLSEGWQEAADGYLIPPGWVWAGT